MVALIEVIENIYKYGNCKFYTHFDNPKEVLGYSFKVDEYGNLNIAQILDTYNSSLLVGDKKSENVILEKSEELLRFKDYDFSLPLSLVASASFYQVPKVIIKEDTAPKANTDKALKKLYEIIYAMFQLSITDLSKWSMGSANNIIEIESQLERKGKKIVSVPEISFEQAITNIEIMIKEISDKLY